MSRRSLLLLVTEDWYFWSHRRELALAARAAGFDVTLGARFTAHQTRIEALGIHCVPISFVRAMGNPWRELTLLWQIARLIGKRRPTVVHCVALKPILLATLAAAVNPRVSFIYAVTGLGHLFIEESPHNRRLRRVVEPWLRWLFAHKNGHVVVQNDDDRALLTANGLTTASATHLIRGAGVDVAFFTAAPLPRDELPLVVLVARMLRDKGIVEFIEAARLLRARDCRVRMVLVGGVDEANPAALTTDALNRLCAEAQVEWWGHRDDMKSVYHAATLVCLPSYREGLPKALLEAAACGRPLLATDVAGCREICIDGQTGRLVKPRDVQSLAAGIAELAHDHARCAEMGARARQLCEAAFSSTAINAQTVALYQTLSDDHQR